MYQRKALIMPNALLNLGALTNDQCSDFLSRIQQRCGGKFSQIDQIKQRKEPNYPKNEL